MTKEEKARFDAAVQAEVTKVIAAQQQEWAATMESAIRASLQGVDQANEALRKEREAVQKELDAAQALRAEAERTGDKMAQEYFEGKQVQFVEAAKTSLLRDLVRMHIEVGKTTRDIAVWLDVKPSFVENIREVMKRNDQYHSERPKRLRLEGNPKLRYANYGRGGTVYYESPDANFDMWWEFAGGNAMVIVDIPTPENWEKQTKLPLSQRQNVLTFIGEQLIDDLNSGRGSFIIGENVLTFYA